MAALPISTDTLRDLPGRVVHIYVGAWALALDSARSVTNDPSAALERVERRGQRVERLLEREWRRLRGDTRSELSRVAGGAMGAAGQPVRWLKRELVATGRSAEGAVERQVARLLDGLGIPTRDRLDALRTDLETLTAKIDLELLRSGPV